MSNTNFQTIHQMGNAISNVMKQAMGRDNVQNIDMDFVTVAQRTRWIENIVSGDAVTFETNMVSPLNYLITNIFPVQNLHGYNNSWIGGAGKNLLGLSLSSIKTLNTGGTWSDNEYTRYGVTFNFIERDGYVERIECSGTATDNLSIVLYSNATGISADNYIFSGCPSGGSTSAYRFVVKDVSTSTGGNSLYEYGSGVSIENTFTIKRIIFTVYSGTDSTGKVIYPMLRLSSVTDATFAPYSNVCPISGFTSVSIVRAGKNIVNPADARPGRIIASNTGAVRDNADHLAYVGFIPVKPNAKYTLSATNIHTREPGSTSGNAYVNVVEYSDANHTSYLRGIVNSTSNDSSYTFTISPDAHYIRFSVGVGASNVQIELGENVTEYTPFVGCDQFNVSFPSEAGTVYGGTLTINEDRSGTLTIDKVLIEVDGTEYFSNVTANNMFFIQSDAYEELSDTSQTTDLCNMFVIAGEELQDGMINHEAESKNIYIKSSIFSGYTGEQLATYFTANNLQLTCDLIESETITLTAEQINTLVGENNIWTDTDNVTVSYNVKMEVI